MEKITHTTSRSEANRTYSAHLEMRETRQVCQEHVLKRELYNTKHALAQFKRYVVFLCFVDLAPVSLFTCSGNFASSATINTMKLPIATVSSQPACNTDFMLLGA